MTILCAYRRCHFVIAGELHSIAVNANINSRDLDKYTNRNSILSAACSFFFMLFRFQFQFELGLICASWRCFGCSVHWFNSFCFVWFYLLLPRLVSIRFDSFSFVSFELTDQIKIKICYNNTNSSNQSKRKSFGCACAALISRQLTIHVFRGIEMRLTKTRRKFVIFILRVESGLSGESCCGCLLSSRLSCCATYQLTLESEDNYVIASRRRNLFCWKLEMRSNVTLLTASSRQTRADLRNNGGEQSASEQRANNNPKKHSFAAIKAKKLLLACLHCDNQTRVEIRFRLFQLSFGFFSYLSFFFLLAFVVLVLFCSLLLLVLCFRVLILFSLQSNYSKEIEC